MIPIGGQLPETDIEETSPPSRTWFLDLDKGRVSGMVDELGAVKQAVFKILQTERFRHLIYSFDYGSELISLIGKSEPFVRAELNRRISEALMQDDRVSGIGNLTMESNGDMLTVRFTVRSVFGQFEVERTVT